MSCGVGHRCGSDLALLWLWCRPAAVAQIRPLAWELPYASGVALKSKNKNKQTKKQSLGLLQHISIDRTAVLRLGQTLCLLGGFVPASTFPGFQEVWRRGAQVSTPQQEWPYLPRATLISQGSQTHPSPAPYKQVRGRLVSARPAVGVTGHIWASESGSPALKAI